MAAKRIYGQPFGKCLVFDEGVYPRIRKITGIFLFGCFRTYPIFAHKFLNHPYHQDGFFDHKPDS